MEWDGRNRTSGRGEPPCPHTPSTAKKVIHHVHPSGEADRQVHPHPRRRRGKAPPRLRVRGDWRVRSVPAARRFPQRPSGRLPGRLPLAPASRDRDHHLRARGHGRSRRQPGQQGHLGGRGRAMDDGRERDPPPGNAAGRCARAHARLPAVGQSALHAEDDRAALSGHSRRRDPGPPATTTAPACG